MLYVSTRNTADTYTAHRALHEGRTSDGGFYAPFHLPVFTDAELSDMKAQSTGDTIAQILNLFFGLHLNGWDVECVIGRQPFKLITMNHRLVIAEVWRNPEGSFRYLIRNLYSLMCGGKNNTAEPTGWAYIAIEIALLIGLYGAMDAVPDQGFDVAVTSGDFADVVAVLYAGNMGLPVNLTVCACHENSVVWDLLNRGEFSTNVPATTTDLTDLECYIFVTMGANEVRRYLDACQRRGTYFVDEMQLENLNKRLFAAVVSTSRVDSVAANMYRINHFYIDPQTAFAYGGLQDYRSRSGISNTTLLVAKERPNQEKE